MKRTSSQQYKENQVSELCYDMDCMQLRSQTSIAPEDQANDMNDINKILDQSSQTYLQGDRDSFTDQIGSLAFPSAIYAKRKSEQPIFAESITIKQVCQNQKIASIPPQPCVSANQIQESKKVLNEFDDIESVTSSMIRLPTNENKIKITAIEFKSYEEIEASLSFQSNYFRNVNGNQNIIRTNMKFTKMNGADIVKSRSKCKNPRPSSGSTNSSQFKRA